MEKWIITGISGSGRIELLQELSAFSSENGKKVLVHDVGKLIFQAAEKANIQLRDNRVLDIDKNLLITLRESALKEVEISKLKNPDIELHLIGVHTTFRWKHRLIEGLSYKNLSRFKINGIINVVDDVARIFETNSINKKWDKETLPNLEETQNWMIEEEFVSQVIADFFNIPMFVIARNHKIRNLYDFFFTHKKKIYLSYPITAIKDTNPEILEKIQNEILEKLENIFVVFNPLYIKDMTLTYGKDSIILPEITAEISEQTKKLIKSRTIERDFQFIDQSDATVVIYPTEKVSPGVFAEIIYSFNNQKPVFIYFEGKRSPFLEKYATYMTDELEDLLEKLESFSNE